MVDENWTDWLDSMRAVMSTSPRDWSSDRQDAWLYGIIWGWSPEALDELCKKHGWDDHARRRLQSLHRHCLAASGRTTIIERKEITPAPEVMCVKCGHPVEHMRDGDVSCPSCKLRYRL